jgi:ATP-binding cassette, subfamily B, bacterial PglK
MSTVVSNHGLLSLLGIIWCHFSLRRRRQLILILLLMVVSMLTEIVSLGAVVPFISVLVAPDKVLEYSLVASGAQIFGITSADQLALSTTIAFIVAAFIAGSIRMTLLWATTRFAFACGTDLSFEIYRRTLYQPYNVHVTRNSSKTISAITQKVQDVISILHRSLLFIISLLLIGTVTSTLIFIDPIVASIAAIGFGLSYGVITRLTQHSVKRNSQEIAREQIQVVKVLQEGLGGIRDVLLNGTQQSCCEIYHRAEYSLRRAIANNLFIAGSPHSAMELLGITLIAILTYSLSDKAGGLSTILPTLGALALGTQRLLPALQQGFSSWTFVIGRHASLVDIVELLEQTLPEETKQRGIAPLNFKETICFDNISYRYSSDGPWVLDGLNFTIPKGARVGFVGSTGSGKSTTLDLLMGLLIPVEGKLLVDGQPISGRLIGPWQQTIAHVSQSVYLADTTLAENIAFGVSPDQIDLDRARWAAHQAQIAEFIESNPKGYNAIVGEHGIFISGGQKQRIGVARALYKQASVLVLDEATSALDNETEQSLMRAIKETSDSLTIFIIAHRLTTIKNCDIIFELENGHIIAQGTYDYLLENSQTFRRNVLATK